MAANCDYYSRRSFLCRDQLEMERLELKPVLNSFPQM